MKSNNKMTILTGVTAAIFYLIAKILPPHIRNIIPLPISIFAFVFALACIREKKSKAVVAIAFTISLLSLNVFFAYIEHRVTSTNYLLVIFQALFSIFVIVVSVVAFVMNHNSKDIKRVIASYIVVIAIVILAIIYITEKF